MADCHASTHPPPTVARVAVLLPLPLAGAYDYAVPPGLALAPGDFVTVTLGGRSLAGVVWGQGTGEIAAEKLKQVIAVLDAPPLTAELRRCIDWVASYTLSPPGAVLRMAMSVPSALDPARMITAYALPRGGETIHSAASPDSHAASQRAAAPPTLSPGPDPGDRVGVEPQTKPQQAKLTSARRRVLAVLADGHPRMAAELARAAGVSPGVVRGMADAGLLATVALSPRIELPQPDPARPGPVLSPAQGDAAHTLCAAVRQAAHDRARVAAMSDAPAQAGGQGGFSVTLLDGVTGSGKTEVYFEAIAAALAEGRQALVLLPEIALTAQWLKRFETRFGAPPFEWHSDLTGVERRLGWRAIAAGEAKVVVGARSALFLPFPDLGLIVVDEEHDPSFKQEDGVIYNARDMAVVRARFAAIPVILSSATPSLETVANVDARRYASLALPERHAGAELPRIEAIDMRAEKMARQSWISPALHAALADTLARGEQAMLFLNRRGYAPLTLCRTCGHRLECPQCTAWLVEHRLEGRLACHHCGFSTAPPPTCPECGNAGSFAACGPGVERVAEEAAAAFPDARIDIMASDTMQSPLAVADLVRRMQARMIDVLIGTQVMAKGHHFPLLTLVGVIDADLGLAGGDLRAAERTYQLLHQVSGRAGRAEHPGRVMLQTYMPDHPVMKALVGGGRDAFLAAEGAARRARQLPPFGRLAALIVSGPEEATVDNAARALGRTRPGGEGVQVLGPAPAPLAVLRGRHRRRLLLKASRDVNVQKVLRDWLSQVRVPGSVRVQVDVDPYSFM